MGVRRGVLLAVAVLLGATSALVATIDVRVGTTNCGSAVLPAEVRPTVRTGDLLDDDFARQVVRVDCARAVTGRRLLALLPAGVALASALAVRHDRRRSGRTAALRSD